jgi:DNA-directed RNA polymerase specialized sigma24 family protein
MKDLEVDDDEWQLAAWFFQDQDKQVPLATLDYHQDLFAVTGTFRAQELDEESYVAFPRQHFYDMFGPFPETFDKNTDMDQLVACPYEYDATNMEFTNKITGGHPFIFHFAGNDWLCACKVFAETGFQNVPNKFRENCEKRHSFWYNRVEDGILYIAASADDSEVLQLHRDTVNIEEDIFVQEERRLERLAEIEDRDLQSVQPYRRPVRRFFRQFFRRGGDDRELVEEEMHRDLQSVQPYRRPVRRFFRQFFRRGGDDRELLKEMHRELKRIKPYKRRSDDRDMIEEEMDRDLQSVQPYRRPVRRFFRRFFQRGGDDRELVEEEFNRELKRIKPYKRRSDDRDMLEEDMDRDLQSVQPYRRPVRRFFRRFFQRGGDDRELVEEEFNRELKRIKPYKRRSDDREMLEEEMDRDLQSVQPYRRPVRRFFRRFFRRGDDRN